MVDVSTTLSRADTVHEGHLTEAIRSRRDVNLPAVILVLDERKIGVHPDILFKVLGLELLLTQTHFGGRPSSRVVDSLFEDQLHLLKGGTEASPVRLESNPDHALRALLLLDDWRVADRHVVLPVLSVHLSIIDNDQLKLFAKDIGQLGAVAVPTTDHTLLLVVIVGAGQKMAEDQLWNPDTSLGVTLDGDGRAIVFDADSLSEGHVNLFDLLGVCRRLVEGVDQNLVKDLEQAWTDYDRFEFKGSFLEDPVTFNLWNDRTHV